MKTYTTIIKAISPFDGQVHAYEGPLVPGISFEDAQNYCEEHGLGYCLVDGEFIGYVAENDNNPLNLKPFIWN